MWLSLAAGLGAWVVLRPAAAQAPTEDLAAAIKTYTGGAAVREGRIRFDIAELIDNGNSVPITISVDSPMTAASHVTSVAVFNVKNPQAVYFASTSAPRSSGKRSA